LTTNSFVSKYWAFFLFIALIIASSLGAVWYWHKAAVQERTFQISNVSIHEEPVAQ